MKTNPLIIRILGLSLGLLCILFNEVRGQNELDQYIEQGIRSNLVVQQKRITLHQAELALKSARSQFLPSINFLTDYTSGDGGRSIALPIGDLLNPVYTTLNQMTSSDDFPTVENVNQNFFPKNFYDARVRTSLPLVNTDLHVNKSIHQQKVVLETYELERYKRQLVMDIKLAYYNLLSAKEAIRIYESALVLVHKNLELNESLQRNGKAVHAQVLRSKSEVERVKAGLNSAKNNATNAQRYFNFLLNADLNAPINTTLDMSAVGVPVSENAESTREEISMIKAVQEINHASLQLNKLSRLPKVSAFVDLGSQASDWEFNNDSRYYLFGVQLSVPIFNGFRNQYSIRNSRYEIQKTEYQLNYTSQELDLSRRVAQNDFQVMLENFSASEVQLKASQSYFNLIEKGYREGINSLIEYLDARNQLTESALQTNLRQLDVLTASARLERENASYQFKL
ncbi:TolC family protein [Pseudochryseolinea flava]|uniref:TolC family protein n=1 Tax=Pseudochryseolinea flava TaxID=2059302 RepID=A0A364XWX0_9BACT|nr:TolC family protein [Pseudochryseolinea flava]RAV98473.1 TolC family protein [Pseudochryseolinea flava]